MENSLSPENILVEDLALAPPASPRSFAASSLVNPSLPTILNKQAAQSMASLKSISGNGDLLNLANSATR